MDAPPPPSSGGVARGAPNATCVEEDASTSGRQKALPQGGPPSTDDARPHKGHEGEEAGTSCRLGSTAAAASDQGSDRGGGRSDDDDEDDDDAMPPGCDLLAAIVSLTNDHQRRVDQLRRATLANEAAIMVYRSVANRTTPRGPTRRHYPVSQDLPAGSDQMASAARTCERGAEQGKKRERQRSAGDHDAGRFAAPPPLAPSAAFALAMRRGQASTLEIVDVDGSSFEDTPSRRDDAATKGETGAVLRPSPPRHRSAPPLDMSPGGSDAQCTPDEVRNEFDELFRDASEANVDLRGRHADSRPEGPAARGPTSGCVKTLPKRKGNPTPAAAPPTTVTLIAQRKAAFAEEKLRFRRPATCPVGADAAAPPSDPAASTATLPVESDGGGAANGPPHRRRHGARKIAGAPDGGAQRSLPWWMLQAGGTAEPSAVGDASAGPAIAPPPPPPSLLSSDAAPAMSSPSMPAAGGPPPSQPQSTPRGYWDMGSF